MLLKNLRISLRNLLRNKLFSAIGIFGFASGFSICLIIGLYVYSELAVDKYSGNYNRIFRLVDAKNNKSDLDYRLHDVLKEKYPVIEKTCPLEIQNSMNADVYTDNSSIYIQGLITTTNDFFEIFAIDVRESISQKPFADSNSSILTKSAAKKIFGDRNPLGKRLKVSHMETTVSAIIADFPANSSIDGNILLNSENSGYRLNSNFANDEIFNTTTHYILLNNAYEHSELEKSINETIASYNKQVKEIALQPLSDIYLK